MAKLSPLSFGSLALMDVTTRALTRIKGPLLPEQGAERNGCQGNRRAIARAIASGERDLCREEAFEIVWVEVGEFSADLEALLAALRLDEVHGDVVDDGHALRSRSCSQPRQVIVEDDIEDPVQPVLNAPMGVHGGGEGLGIEPG